MYFRSFLFLTLLLALVDTVSAKVIFVCPKCKIQKIGTALEAARDGDTIRVQGGTYFEEDLLITKKLQLIGEDFPTIDNQFRGNGLEITSDFVLVEGLRIVNSKVSDIREFAGIYLNNVSNVIVKNNKLENNAYGIYLEKSRKSRLEGNESWGNAVDEVNGGNGIHLWTSHEIEIEKNYIHHHRDGLYFEFSEDLIVKENVSEESIRYGMHFMFSHRSRIENSLFTNNSTGAAIMYSREIQLVQNTFEKSRGQSSYGILLKDITDGLMENNVFSDNTIGIFGDSFTRNRIVSNTILRNGWALQILGSCEKNVFSGNRFEDNIFDVSTNSRNSENLFQGNFWSKYEGFDLDRDGVGDIPHSPVSFFSYWVAKYDILLILLESPVIRFLEISERMFPIMRPDSLLDESPRIFRREVI